MRFQKIAWAALALWAIAVLPAGAFLGIGFGVQSRLPDGPVQIDGRATEWALMPVLETHGLSFRAMNDASNLYLLIRGTDSDGRILLSGQYRQNVTLWFLNPSGKTKTWGILFDFLHASVPDSGPGRTHLCRLGHGARHGHAAGIGSLLQHVTLGY